MLRTHLLLKFSHQHRLLMVTRLASLIFGHFLKHTLMIAYCIAWNTLVLYIMSHQMATYCQPVSGISGRRHLRSADRGHLDFPRVRLASYGGRSFAYVGPSNWNSLFAYLRDSSLSLSSFRHKHHLKTFLFSFY